jgi:hypothetical protein
MMNCIGNVRVFKIIHIDQRTSRSIAPTSEGKSIIVNGSYEYSLYQAIPSDGGIEQAELMVDNRIESTTIDQQHILETSQC